MFTNVIISTMAVGVGISLHKQLYFCSTSLPLTNTIWVQSTIKLYALSTLSKQCAADKSWQHQFWGDCQKSNPLQWERSKNAIHCGMGPSLHFSRFLSYPLSSVGPFLPSFPHRLAFTTGARFPGGLNY